MWVKRLSWCEPRGWRHDAPGSADGNASLVLYFGDRALLASGARHAELRQAFPRANVVGCSSGGQICDGKLHDGTIAAVAIDFERTRVQVIERPSGGPYQSRADGEALGRALSAEDLAFVFVLSDGLCVNGSALVTGLTGAVGPDVTISGGLAGDGANFQETLVGANACPPLPGRIAAIGFYGPAVRLGHGTRGGWEPFGPNRRITRSDANVLSELDGRPALDLYERYLGEEAASLPGSALLFPLRIWDPDRPASDIVRSVLGIDRAARSMTFAGDIPQGWRAQLMHGSLDHLTEAAGLAAQQARLRLRDGGGQSLALLVSCIGRRLLMGQRVVEEIEAASAELSSSCTQLGFYAYGEISPHANSGGCELHNQTMTVTMITECALV